MTQPITDQQLLCLEFYPFTDAAFTILSFGIMIFLFPQFIVEILRNVSWIICSDIVQSTEAFLSNEDMEYSGNARKGYLKGREITVKPCKIHFFNVCYRGILHETAEYSSPAAGIRCDWVVRSPGLVNSASPMTECTQLSI